MAIKLKVEPITVPNLINLLVIISSPGMKAVNAETTEEYNIAKKTTLVNSRDLNL